MCQGYASKKEWFIWAVLMRFTALRWIARRMYPEWRQWLVVILMLPLVGCATMWTVAQSPVFQRAVEYGVIKYLSSEPDQQPQALEIVQYLQRSVDQSAQVTVSDLENLAMDQIPWQSLDVADQYLLRSMIEDIADHLRDRVGSGVLAEDDRVKLKDFLSWMEQAVRFAGA
jgi:hypothetical protein